MVAKDKEYLHKLHDKYYGKKKEQPKKETALGNTGEKAGSRKDLMDQARLQGIKYFRILTKTELMKVLDPKTIQQDIDGIISEAKARWKSGWSKEKKA